MNSVVPGKFRNDGIHQFLGAGIEVSVLLLALGFRQPVRKLHQHHLHLRIVKAAMVDGIHDFCNAVPALLPEFVTKVGLLLIDLQQILPEDLLCQIALDGFDALGGEVSFVRIDRVGHHMHMRMVSFIMERSIPPKILRRNLHLLGNHIPMRAEQMHPGIGCTVTQPLRIFPAQRNDVRPDISGMFIHLFLNLRQHNGNTLVREQAVAAGTLINIFQIYIPLRSIAVQFQNAADERIRVAAGSVVSIIPVLVTVLAVRVLFQQPCDLLLLFCGGRKMAGGIFRHLRTFPGGDIFEVASGLLFAAGLQIGGFQNKPCHPLSPFLKFYRILEAVFPADGSNFVGAEPAESG